MADPTANEEWRDAIVAHVIAQLRLFGTLSNRVAQILDTVEAEIADQVRRRTSDIVNSNGVDVNAPRVSKRLRALQEVIADLRAGVLSDSYDEVLARLRDVAVAEPAFMTAKLGDTMPVIFDTILPSKRTLEAIASNTVIQGDVMKDWFKKIEADDLNRIMNEIRIGLTQGQGTDDLVRRIIGTSRLNGGDGVTQITRNNADAIVRTAGQTIAQAARDAFFQENADFFEWEVYTAVLDSRTTAICRSLDGKRFKVGDGPKPPLHWRCRSTRVAIVTDDGSLIGRRPFNDSTEEQLLREFAAKQGLDRIPKSRKNLPRGTKGAFDDFARARARQLIGKVPAETTYAEFLKRLPADRQDDILGKTKGRLYRQGKLSVDRFVDPKTFKEYTLRQLVIRDADAFRRAGLNPEDYL